LELKGQNINKSFIKINIFHEISPFTSFVSYSMERDDREPKVWYKQDILLMEAPEEVQLDMVKDPRVHVMPDHSLVLHNVTNADAGVYHCLDFSFVLEGKPLEVTPFL
jgi:hypothetical protein